MTTLALTSFTSNAKPMLHRPFIADLSEHLIKIDTKFTGVELLLFGARNDPGDIIVVVRGPKKSYIVRKKEKLAGVWVNRKQVSFENVESFYNISSSSPIEIIKNDYIFKNMSIGLDNLSFTQESSSPDDFEKALINEHINNNLYNVQITPISFIGNALFCIELKFPENIIPGIYMAEVYLFNNGELKSIQTTPIQVVKTGLDAMIYRMANVNYVIYGFLTVFLAVLSGFTASWLFRKN